MSCISKVFSCISKGFKCIRTNAEVIKIVFALCAAGWILIEYSAKQKQARIERTVDYAKKLDEGALLAADLKMTLFWLEPAILQELQSLPQGDKEAFANFIVKKVESSLKQEVWQLFGFYRGLAICVNTGLCDPSTACSRFRHDLMVFSENYGPYFERYYKAYHDDALQPIRMLLKTQQCLVSNAANP